MITDKNVCEGGQIKRAKYTGNKVLKAFFADNTENKLSYLYIGFLLIRILPNGPFLFYFEETWSKYRIFI